MNWLRRILGASFAILVVAGIVVPLSTHLAPLSGRQVFAVRGASMAPAIPMGAVIVVGDHGTDDLATGDVITWRGDNGVVVTHRIIQIVADGGERLFQTQGDANASPDGFVVPERAVVGSVEFWIPGAGFVLMMLATPMGVISWLSFAVAVMTAQSLIPRGGSAPAPVRPPEPRRHRRLLPRRTPATASRWPVHFEGVTLLGDDTVLLDDMTRCADGDHTRCVTDVSPRACVIGVQAWSALATVEPARDSAPPQLRGQANGWPPQNVHHAAA